MRGANALQARARTYLNEIITIMLAGAVTITNSPLFLLRCESSRVRWPARNQETATNYLGPHPDFQPELSILKSTKLGCAHDKRFLYFIGEKD
jgi:hypothetical protein